MNADDGCCTTERQNTYVNDRREVLYRWRPWFGRTVYVHEVIDKPGVAVFRCNLTGSRSDGSPEVPFWMFDRVACAGCRGVDTAHVGLDTLTVLAKLVRETGRHSFDNSDSSSRAGAALDSEPTIGGRPMLRKTMATQPELFPEIHSIAATPIPPRQSLPDDTRQALTRLSCL